MPVRSIAGTDLAYALVIFDEKGNERPEPDGTFLSETLAQRIADPARPVTDVFFTAHGWQGDVPAAIAQFDRWIAAVAGQQADRAAAEKRPGGFAPLIIGLHWPSLPFGDEKPPAGAPAVLSADAAGGPAASRMSTPGRRASPTRRPRVPRSARSSTRRASSPARQRLRRPSSAPTRRSSPNPASTRAAAPRHRAPTRKASIRPRSSPRAAAARPSRRRSCSASATRSAGSSSRRCASSRSGR
jgi:hypothetical protein